LLSYLPPFLRKSKIYVEIFNTDEQQIASLNTNIQEIEAQLNVDTATWGLAIYEKELGIKTDLNKSFNDRRSVIKSKLRGTGKIGVMQLKLVADAYTNGNVEISFDGKINIHFTSVRGIPPNMYDLETVIEEIKPAHLGVTYAYLFTTWDRFDSFNYTWDALDALNKTWDEIEVI
jgi:hypothetical protein